MRLRQQDSKNRSYSTVEVDQAIREKYVMRKAMLPPAHAAEASAFTISAGGDTFTVTLAGTTYSDADDVRLRLRSTGQFLIRSTVEEIDAFRAGSPSVQLGVPRHFALWETKVGTLVGRCYPGALAAEAVDMFRSLSHTLPASASDLDAAAVYFNEATCHALALDVAADLLAALPESELPKRRLNPGIAKEWKREAEKLFYQEHARLNDIQDMGRVQRWVS